jgi:hypothetical protein
MWSETSVRAENPSILRPQLLFVLCGENDAPRRFCDVSLGVFRRGADAYAYLVMFHMSLIGFFLREYLASESRVRQIRAAVWNAWSDSGQSGPKRNLCYASAVCGKAKHMGSSRHID